MRNRWFVLYGVIFVALSVGFSSLALEGSNVIGEPGFGRTSAGLLNLMLLMIPLIALTIGAQSLVSERQDRNLDYLLAQPVSPVEVYLGKYLGAAASLCLLLLFGFGCSGLVMALRGTTAELGDYLWLVALTLVLGLGMLSVGYLVSSLTSHTAAALGIAVTLWLLFVVIGDLGLMGSTIAMDLRPDTLLGLTAINPLDVYKLAAVDRLQPSLDVLGPAGTYAFDRLGSALAPVMLLIMALWVLLPLPVGYRLFKRTDIR
jgi:Cu-processing system permease protein